MFKILVVDQFSGLTPYWLQKNPTPFAELVSDENLAAMAAVTPKFGTKPHVLETDESWSPEMCQTSVRANPETGLAEVWKCRWDSSG